MIKKISVLVKCNFFNTFKLRIALKLYLIVKNYNVTHDEQFPLFRSNLYSDLQNERGVLWLL